MGACLEGVAINLIDGDLTGFAAFRLSDMGNGMDPGK